MIHHGDCLDVMATMPADSIDAVVTDPPYGLEFMGKEWDRLAAMPDRGPGPRGRNAFGGWHGSGVSRSSNLAQQQWHEQWATEAFRVLKPGGYLVAFGGTRTYHRLASAIEDAGFEIRDTLMWIYASGFPKSLSVEKALRAIGNDELADKYAGCGTATKPAHEPIVLARKPLVGTVAANVSRYGTGAINVDACRIPGKPGTTHKGGNRQGTHPAPMDWGEQTGHETNGAAARWPSNVLLSDPELFDEPNPGVVGSGASAGSVVTFEQEANIQGKARTGGDGNGVTLGITGPKNAPSSYGDSGGYSRFFAIPRRTNGHAEDASPRADRGGVAENRPNGGYVGGDAGADSQAGGRLGVPPVDYPTAYLIPKADRAERERGLAGAPKRGQTSAEFGGEAGRPGRSLRDGEWVNTETPRNARANSHPTVKPLDLMRHLVRLVTPPGGTVLDPFAGSGSTLIAAELEGFPWIGIEKEAEYVAIAEGRLNGTQRGLGLDFGDSARMVTEGSNAVTADESAA